MKFRDMFHALRMVSLAQVWSLIGFFLGLFWDNVGFYLTQSCTLFGFSMGFSWVVCGLYLAQKWVICKSFYVYVLYIMLQCHVRQKKKVQTRCGACL